MANSRDALKERLTQLHPDIQKLGIEVSLIFDGNKDAYEVKLMKDGEEFIAYLDRRDADDCLNGVECYHLGLAVADFVQRFKEKLGK